MTVLTSTTRPVNDPNGGPFTPTQEDLARILVEKGAAGGNPRPGGVTADAGSGTPKMTSDWVTNFGNPKTQGEGVDLTHLPKNVTNPNGDIALVTGEDAPVNPLLLTLTPGAADGPGSMTFKNGGPEGISEEPKKMTDAEKAAKAGFVKEKPELKQFQQPNNNYQTAVDRAHQYQNESTAEMVAKAFASAWNSITGSKMVDPDQATPTNAFASVEKLVADMLGAGAKSMDTTMNKATGGTHAHTTKTIGALSDGNPHNPTFQRSPEDSFGQGVSSHLGGSGGGVETAKTMGSANAKPAAQENGMKVVGALDGLLKLLGKETGSLVPDMQKGLPDQLDGKWLGNAMEKFGFDPEIFAQQPIALSTADLTLVVGLEPDGDLYIALADQDDIVYFGDVANFGDVAQPDAVPAQYKTFDWDQYGFA